MTQPLEYFKMFGAIVALCLPLGCTSDIASTQNQKIEQRLNSLQTQSQQLEETAFEIESQIDEIRRASPDTRSDEIETLHTQFKRLKSTHEALQKEMRGLRQELSIGR